jgi:hypothetical protein
VAPRARRRPPPLPGRVAACLALSLSLAAARPAHAQPPPAPDAAPAPGCPQGNLLERAELIRWIDTAHATALLTDHNVIPEGAEWLSQAVVFQSAAGSLTYDLGAELPIRALFVQAEARDRFSLFTSKDGKTWQGYAVLEVPDLAGMRTRLTTLDGVSARYVRFGEPVGGGSHAATELQLFCDVPADMKGTRRLLVRDPEPDPGLASLSASERTWLCLTGAPWLTELQASAAKLALAVSALALLLFGVLVKRGAAREAVTPSTLLDVPWTQRAVLPAAALVGAPLAFLALAATWPHGQATLGYSAALALAVAAAAALAVSLRVAFTGPLFGRAGGVVAKTSLPRLRGALLCALAVTSYAGYYNWGSYHFPDYTHHHELFHYVTGAKYFRELGYQGLYRCASAAEAEQGFKRRVELRQIRDLRTNAIVDGAAALKEAQDCKQSFTPERWAAFKADVAYFRDHAEVGQWHRMLRDHGYNPSPVWTMTGSALANLRPASRGFIGHGDSMFGGALTLLDPALLLAAFGAVLWAFGWQTACVAAVFFGCNPLSTYLWTGGAYLRQDWFAAAVIGICLLRKGRAAAGGAGLGYATLLRVFPGGFLLPIAVGLGLGFWKERRLDRTAARVLAAALVAVALLVPISSAAVGGFKAWPAFVDNLEKQVGTPSANLVGLRTVLSFRPSARAEVLAEDGKDDAFARVREARRAGFRQLLPVYAVLVGGLLYALLRVARLRKEPWVLATLGIAVIPVMTELSCYYLSLLTVGALLHEEAPEVPVALLALAAGIHALQLGVGAEDVRYACASVLVVAFAGWLLWSRGTPPRPVAAGGST